MFKGDGSKTLGLLEHLKNPKISPSVLKLLARMFDPQRNSSYLHFQQVLARTKREDMVSYNFGQFIDAENRNDRNEANVCLVLDAFNNGYQQL